MAKKMIVTSNEWEKPENKYKYCEALEGGNILFFPSTPISFPKDEIDFLLKGENTRLKGDGSENLKGISEGYSKRVTAFLSALLSPYANQWKIETAGLSPFKKNGLLHLDAFKAFPLHGSRILRFFTNVDPAKGRKWVTSKGFADLFSEFAEKVKIPSSTGYDLKSRLERKMKGWLRTLGLKAAIRSPYDTFMLKLQSYLNANREFQEKCDKDYWDFPPGSSWAFFTDQISHAFPSDECTLTHTLIVPQRALLLPETSPLRILERISGKNLVDPRFLAEMFSV